MKQSYDYWKKLFKIAQFDLSREEYNAFHSDEQLIEEFQWAFEEYIDKTMKALLKQMQEAFQKAKSQIQEQ